MEKINDELIAEFMKCSKPPNPDFDYFWKGEFFKVHNAKWNKSWDWLMPVVEKIELIEISGYRFKVIITKEGCKIYSWIRGSGKKYIKFDNTGYPKIKAVFTSVVQFIKWHNQQKS